ncbi:beta-ketoacyl synthase N-terminal-like domain-containing protein [Sulfitobacter porphyrae]|uniref:Beta-ketoacyl synthase N-terminal-like domain-containing protein n=1 Tax=Sulfitobacter porphyrae TaxID=1246864 RepID=A0ABW2B6M5_9RHOB
MSAWLAAACRSAVAPRDGALSALSLHELGAPVIKAVLAQAGLTAEDVDELIVSNALGAGGNPARVLALAAGLPERVAGLSIDRQCAGGLDAVVLARQMVLAGAADVVVAGGVESYSRRPLRLRRFADGRAPEAYEQAEFTPGPTATPTWPRPLRPLVSCWESAGRRKMPGRWPAMQRRAPMQRRPERSFPLRG